MKVLVFGATGLIGRGVLHECLDHPQVHDVLSIGRRKTGVVHPQLREHLHDDFTNFSGIADMLKGFDACFWCLGISSFGMDEASYTRITYDFTMAAADVLTQASPVLCFCFVSGAGTDHTQRSRSMWARVKGRTENALKEKSFPRLFLFRPGFISCRGVKDPRSIFVQALDKTFAPVLRAIGAQTSNQEIGRAMIAVVSGQAAPQIIDSKEINHLADALSP
ncbi:MAG: NAD-dependent epimerase/dehydratase family protein [Pseudomonadota bacterium]